MPSGWEPIEVVHSDALGAWSVVERGGSYREAADRAMMWRSHGADPYLEMRFGEDLWLAECLSVPFQRILAHGLAPRPYLVAERVRAITARRLLERGPLPIGVALKAGIALCRALQDLEAVTSPSGEPVPVRGTGLGLDDLWLTAGGPRFRNPVRLAKMLGGPPHVGLDLLSPEQARGAPPGEPERDVYAVAMSVLSLIRGRSPLLRDTAEDTLRQVLAPERELPVAGLPDSLTATLLRALDANPSKRPPDAAALEAEWRSVSATHGIDLPATLSCPDDEGLEWRFR